MSSEKRLLKNLLLFIAILFGSFLRLNFTLARDFPINDGGMFWVMVQDLIRNHYVLPQYTTYNLDQIPYTYPPAAFYLLAVLHQFGNLSLESLLRFVPLFFSIAGLFLIYPIASLTLASSRQAILAVFAYALMQPAYAWSLMGGGVTRSPAQFFSYLAIFFTLLQVRKGRRWAWTAGSACSIALTAYFHIEVAWVTALLMVFLVFLYDRKNTLRFTLIHAAAGLVLLLPYWGTVLQKHGFGPFLNAFQSGSGDPLLLIRVLMIPQFTGETLFPVLAVLGFLGIIACIATRQVVPLLWLIFACASDLRSVHRNAVLPEALLIAMSVDFFVIAALEKISPKPTASGSKQDLPRLPYLATAGIFGYAFLLLLFQQYAGSVPPALSAAERDAFAWVKTQTNPDASFLILPSGLYWAEDYIFEWFPALAQRKSILTVQGYEWIAGGFQRRVSMYKDLSTCLYAGPSCFATWRSENKILYDYLLIPKRTTAGPLAEGQLREVEEGCRVVFQNTGAEIYQCRQ
jgi:hypothetical protein